MELSEQAYVDEIDGERARDREALRGPRSVLAAIARHELQLSTATRVGPPGCGADIELPGCDELITIVPTERGFRVNDADRDPGIVKAGRYLLRLSHQGYPAVVVLDRDSPRLREDVELRWFPVVPALRFRTHLEPDTTTLDIASTASAARRAERAGWVRFTIDAVEYRLAATRLLEPGVHADHLDVLFRDGTTGQESYSVGRYVTLERDADAVILDFNRAYNPSCALSPYYNCPIPPPENQLPVAIRAGEMAPRLGGARDHR